MERSSKVLQMNKKALVSINLFGIQKTTMGSQLQLDCILCHFHQKTELQVKKFYT